MQACACRNSSWCRLVSVSEGPASPGPDQPACGKHMDAPGGPHESGGTISAAHTLLTELENAAFSLCG